MKVFQRLLDEIEVARGDLRARDPEVEVGDGGGKPAYYLDKLDEVYDLLESANDRSNRAVEKDNEAAQTHSEKDRVKSHDAALAKRSEEANAPTTGFDPLPGEPQATERGAKK